MMCCQQSLGGIILRKLSAAVDRFAYNHPRFGIPNLMLYIVGANALIYLLTVFAGIGPVSFLAFDWASIKAGEVWRLEENLYPFVELVSGVLSDDPLFIVLNSYTTGLAPSVLTYILETLISKRFGGHTVSDELGLPVTQSGLVLPCGATGRWTSSN